MLAYRELKSTCAFRFARHPGLRVYLGIALDKLIKRPALPNPKDVKTIQEELGEKKNSSFSLKPRLPGLPDADTVKSVAGSAIAASLLAAGSNLTAITGPAGFPQLTGAGARAEWPAYRRACQLQQKKV